MASVPAKPPDSVNRATPATRFGRGQMLDEEGPRLCRESAAQHFRSGPVGSGFGESVRREPLKLAGPVPSPLYLNHIAWLIAVI